MLLQRILTAAVGIPVTVYLIQSGGWLFSLAIIILALLAWREYCQMLRCRQIEVGMAGGAGMIILLLLSGWCGNSEELLLAVWLLLLLTLLRTLLRWSREPSFVAAAFSLFGVIYIGFSFLHLLLLRQLNGDATATMGVGTVYLWAAFLATWGSDTFAYFVGSLWGRRKLCPAISPRKSVEGFIGGVLGAVVAVLIFGYFTEMPLMHRLMTGLIGGLVSPVGDLAESALKRFCGVKDSGSLLPGHGGVLDRFDSILFSVPAVYYYVQLIVLN
ncbi:MAG: phosphatidate cytidylyltransferase [Sporomusaceae bacterium]|nr:phosphatidate cytidylyltransferase [Sporomusaceae bacterium]